MLLSLPLFQRNQNEGEQAENEAADDQKNEDEEVTRLRENLGAVIECHIWYGLVDNDVEMTGGGPLWDSLVSGHHGQFKHVEVDVFETAFQK